MDANIHETASVFIEVSNEIFMPEHTEVDQNSSTDDDIPLSKFKIIPILNTNCENIYDFKKRKKSNQVKRNNKKVYEYKNGKKIFRQSDSESEDFEKYVYFDEGKIKRKVKLDPNLSKCTLMKQIEDIKIENECLNLERGRINMVKLQEKNKLHAEIKRLKYHIKDLRLRDNSNNEIVLNIGNTTDVINAMNKYLEDDLVASNCSNDLDGKLNNSTFTDSSFWEGFNSIEEREDFKNVYWKGNLKNINPNSDEYFKPDDSIRSIVYSDIEYKSHKEDIVQNSPQNIQENDNQTLMESKQECNDRDLKIVDESFTSDMEIDDVIMDERDEVEEDLKNIDEGICSECGHDSSWPAFILRHRKAYNENIKLIPCNLCNMKFLKSGHFDGKHRSKRPERRKNNIRSFICDVCGQGCTTQSGLVQHQLKHKEPLYSCKYCPYKCQRRTYLRTHMNTHLNESKGSKLQKKYPCSICPQISTSMKDFRLHRSTHKSANIFTCKLCFFTTNKFNTFMKHDSSHISEKGYQCVYCNYRTMSKSHLNSHIKYHTGKKPTSIIDGLFCDQCSFETVSPVKMDIHKRKHDGDKSFSCNLCQYECFTRYDLMHHDNMHKSDNMLQCEFCDFKTAAKNKLKNHMKKHDDEIAANI